MLNFTHCFEMHWIFCSMMVVLIWMIQILHYPSFFYVEEARFLNFHKFHTNRISWIVAPIMCIEFFSAIVLFVLQSDVFWVFLNLVLTILIWIFTFFVSVPIHNLLSSKKEDRWIQKLIRTNWIRTVLWSFRFLLLTYVYFSSFLDRKVFIF